MNDPPHAWDAAQQRRALVAWVWRTSAFPFFAAQFFVYYLKELGADDVAIGLATALPSAAWTMQFVGAVLAERAASRKRLVLVFFGLRLLCWLPVIGIGWWAAGHVERAHFALVAFIALITVGAGLFHLHSPAWDSWFSDALPDEEKGNFFGRWSFWTALTGGVVLLAGGWLVDHATQGTPQFQRLLLTLFALGVCCSGVGWLTYTRLTDTEHRGQRIRAVGELVRAATGERNYLRFIAAYCWFWLVSGLYLSFSFAWFKTDLGLSLTFLGAVGALQSIVIALCSRWFGPLARRFGAKSLFWLGLWGQVIWPLVFFAYTPRTVRWLAPIHWALAGFFGAALSVAVNVLWYSLPQPTARTMKFAMAWVLFGLAGAVGALIGGYVAQHAPPLRIAGVEFSRYHWLFLAGAVGVLPCFWLLKTFREVGEQPPQRLAAWFFRRWTERRMG